MKNNVINQYKKLKRKKNNVVHKYSYNTEGSTPDNTNYSITSTTFSPRHTMLFLEGAIENYFQDHREQL